MVNAKLAVEAALLTKDGYYNVSVTAGSEEGVVFTDESGRRFVFETDKDGLLTCVMKEGSYTVKTESAEKTVTVHENKDIIM